MAKTSNSLTGDPSIKGAPTGFKLDINDIFVAVGAKFVVASVGEVRLSTINCKASYLYFTNDTFKNCRS